MTGEDTVEIPVDSVRLEGNLHVPSDADGIVLFAHGSGSSRKSPRNNFVAERLHEFGLGTLLFDLLTEAEDETYANRFDIELLTDRLVAVTEWVEQRPETEERGVGYFGSSTGAAAALRGAARRPEVGATVSRGGRVDLATEVLADVTAPTLFIVGGRDTQVLELNREAYDRLRCEKELEVVPGAGHLFEEPGTLESVATLAGEWFSSHL
ncbi:hydrolase [Haladaptatus sp. W1]|uniref:dienelactone hydrolase family protein n=1 Tax=unclassified Haladaptatus TaxID=2622732 RepID=UPI000849D193|nr:MULTISPECIES: dienelactone hydrolase family protein [unclassified Haladaptatus]ODR83105.1 hydrolase [Haladaptatus sp. W1]GKZ14365.1 DeoR family transcriptional regulator [Haladaptatus sp. T7]